MTVLAEAACSCCGSPPLAGTHSEPAYSEAQDARARRRWVDRVFDPVLLARRAPAPIAIEREALGKIRSGARGGWSAFEVGAGLLGYRDRRGLVVVDAAVPTPRGNRDSCEVDYGAASCLALELGLALVGGYHTHPGGAPRPSPIDMRSMRGLFLMADAPVVEVVVVPETDDPWAELRLHAYVMRRTPAAGANGVLVVEPARIEGDL